MQVKIISSDVSQFEKRMNLALEELAKGARNIVDIKFSSDDGDLSAMIVYQN